MISFGMVAAGICLAASQFHHKCLVGVSFPGGRPHLAEEEEEVSLRPAGGARGAH